MQSTVTQARQSSFARQAENVPVLRPSMLSRQEGFVGLMNFAASLPRRAPEVVAELEKYQKSYRLDSTLSAILKRAKATVNRGNRIASFH